MAGAVVGQALLSAFINVVFDRLASPEFVNLIRRKKLDDNLLQRLKNTMYAIEAVLNDAELKQIKDSPVNKWLDDLKDAVYEADNFLDRVSTEAATQKEASHFFSRLLNFQDREIATKLEGIVARLESIFKLKDILGLKESGRENLPRRSPSTSLVEGSHIYGRDNDKETILKLLLDEDDKSDTKISVIPVVGMGGVGKTTLAQLLYNDDNLKRKFDIKVWVCVSEEFDILKVTKTITEAVSGGTSNTNDINLLHLDLKEKMSAKRFFIVLDDVWIEDYVTWINLVKPFQYGIKGSKILVTTRSKKVASLVQTFQGYHLKELSNDDCWSVFANHACLSLDSDENMALQTIGREIVKRCKGLPLAAQSLGGLRGKHDVRDWNNILNSNIWEISEKESTVIPALRISYHYLPSYLKSCFVYCSLYPKDYEFHKEELILLWMAEDLIQPPKKGKTLEEVGYSYFDDLTSRSFFQHSHSNMGKSYFVMHDLIHDLATSLGGEFYFRSEELSKETKIDAKTRHLSFSMFSDAVSEDSCVCGRVNFLRTFLPINLKESPFNDEKTACSILLNLKYVRVLSFRKFSNLDAISDSIGRLIHLRYLDLSRTVIQSLPESLSKLYNLQTLKLSSCSKLTKLPSGMQDLKNLCHLDVQHTPLEEMPARMSRLNNLQHMSDYVVGKDEENRVKELGTLSNLQGWLRIGKIENVRNKNEALEAKIIEKEKLDGLQLEWSSEANCWCDSRSEMDILQGLQPHQNLRRLSISGYKGTKFAEWVGHCYYQNIIKLTLYRCENCSILPPLGQLVSLESLYIGELNGLERIGCEFYKKDDWFSGTPFPSLKYLSFGSMPCWEVWRPLESDVFPKLKQLHIRRCGRLKGDLPSHLPALESLEISDCEELAFSIPRWPVIKQLEIKRSSKVALEGVPPLLEHLQIEGRQVEWMIETITKSQPNKLQLLLFCAGLLTPFS